DTAATWLLGGTGDQTDMDGGSVAAGVPSPRAQVLITVPVMALLGQTDEPAMLDGYGPIPPSMARRLIADGAESFHRVLIDPRDGAPLEIGRTSYRLTKAQRQWLRLRDGKCPFPGCSNHSLDNEADHLLAWAKGGSTGISNLGQPCRKHHRLRHITGWKPTTATKNEPPSWISPTGRHYQSEHPDWEPPQWPKPWPDDPVSEPQPSGLRLPGNELPDCGLPSDDIVPDEALPDGPMPEDPYPNWDFTAHSTVRPPAPSDASAK
uniref:HNH endonuclease signature motif containing protein n=1 Tax=Pseudarthrobacter sp. TaxID=1934409 RepID=UPI002FCA16F4